jgi:hypothetical protein
MAIVKQYTLHQNETAPSDGDVAFVEAYNNLTLYITGTSATRTITFQAALVDGRFVNIQGANLTTMDMAATTTGTEQLWQFDVNGVRYFRAKLDAVTGGDVTIVCNFTA